MDNYLRAIQAILRSTNAVSTATIASASTTDLATSDAEHVQVTGSATITSLGTGYAGCFREVRFAGACTIVHSSAILLPGGLNVTTAANDMITFRCMGSGQWFLSSWSRPSAAATGAVAKTGDTMTGQLNVNTASGYQLRLHATGQTNYLEAGVGVAGATDPDAFIFNRANGAVWFGTNNTLRLKLTAAGVAEFSVPITSTSSVTATQVTSTGNNFVGGATGVALGPNGAGPVVLRPNGVGSTSGQVQVATDGKVTTTSDLTLGGTLFCNQFVASTAASLFVATASAGNITFRPNGPLSSSNQAVLDSAGALTLNGGRKVSQIQLSTSAPGVLADGVLYLQY